MTITLTREEAQQVLDALTWCYDVTEWPANGSTPQDKAIETLRARLAQCNRCGKVNPAEIHTCTPLPEPEPVAWKVWTVHNHIFFSIGVQTFQINDVLEHEPEVSAKEFSEWLATQLRHALIQLSTAPPQRKEWQGLTDEERTYLAWESNNGPHCVAMTEALLKEKNT